MDILTNAEFMPTEVGHTVYVWSPGGQKPPANRTRSCVISAHGVESFVTSKFGKPANVELVYYCPHGWNLAEVALRDVATGQLKPKETIPGNIACQDYALSKLQGRDAFVDETYALIQHGMHRAAREQSVRNRNVLTKQVVDSFKKSGKTDLIENLAFNRDLLLSQVVDPIYDVVTIRDRKYYNPPTLFEVIGLLEKVGFHYKNVHCAFCRGFASGGSMGWSPKKKNV